MQKFHRTRYGEDRNDNSPVLATRLFGAGNDKIRYTATANDLYSDRIHNGVTIAKHAEDLHNQGSGKGQYSLRKSTGKLFDL